MKNKKILIILLIMLIILIFLGIYLYKYSLKNNEIKIPKAQRPPLKIDILNDGKKIGQAIGIISSWKNNDAISTSSLVTANVVLEKEKIIDQVKAGDMITLSLEEVNKELFNNIYQVTYNAISDEDIETPVLPIDEVIEVSNCEIQVPILRENINKVLYYYVSVSIKDKGTIMYYFKVKS